MASFLFTGELIGSDITDFLQTYVITNVQLDMIYQGQLPIGVFELPNLYGGYYGFPSHFSLFFIPEMVLLFFQYLTQDLILTVNISLFLVLVISQITSFLLFRRISKSFVISVIGSTLYTFSSWYATEMYWGHYILLFGAAFLPLAILQLEKALSKPSTKTVTRYLIVAGIIFLSSFEILYTLFLFTILRTMYEIASRNRSYLKTIFHSAFKPSLILFLFVVPIVAIIMTFLNICGTNLTEYYSSTFYLDPLTLLQPRWVIDEFNEHLFDINPFIFFLLILGLAQVNKKPKPIIFYTFITFAFLLFSVTSNTTLSRVPFRNLLMVDLAFTVIAIYGLSLLKHKSTFIHIAALILIFTTSFTIFGTNPLPELSQAETYLSTVPDDGRMVIYPTKWAQSNYVAYETGHEVVGQSAIEVRNYPYYSQHQLYLEEALQLFPWAENLDRPELMRYLVNIINIMTPITGVKYMIINDLSVTFLPYIYNYTTFVPYMTFNDSIILINSEQTYISPVSLPEIPEKVNLILTFYYITLVIALVGKRGLSNDRKNKEG